VLGYLINCIVCVRIFSPKGIDIDDELESIEDLEDSHPSKKNRGVLRAKVEAGEGTIPVANLISGYTYVYFKKVIENKSSFINICKGLGLYFRSTDVGLHRSR